MPDGETSSEVQQHCKPWVRRSRPTARIAETSCAALIGIWQHAGVPGGDHHQADSNQLRQLLEAAVHGDDHALGELVKRTQPAVWRVCAALGSPGEVEDLVQETYLRAMRSLVGYRGEAPVRSWLLSIARNVCADHVRRRVRMTRLRERIINEPKDWAAPHDHNPLTELVEELSEDRREAFVLTQLCGLSYAEAADVAGCPVGTIRSRVARARADLALMVRHADAM